MFFRPTFAWNINNKIGSVNQNSSIRRRKVRRFFDNICVYENAFALDVRAFLLKFEYNILHASG